MIQYPGIGTYEVMLLDSNYCGIDTAFIQITIVPPPQVTLTVDPDTICIGETVTWWQRLVRFQLVGLVTSATIRLIIITLVLACITSVTLGLLISVLAGDGGKGYVYLSFTVVFIVLFSGLVRNERLEELIDTLSFASTGKWAYEGMASSLSIYCWLDSWRFDEFNSAGHLLSVWLSLGVFMLTAAVLAADYMLSPVEMEAYSLQGMKKMVAVISNLRKQNPKLRFLGMVPNKVDARKPRHVANLAALQQAYPQLVLPFSVGARDSIAQALGEQMPVWKIKKTAARKATQEVRELADYVFTKMEIAQ